MTFMSRLFARLAKLPPAETSRVLVERDLKATMPDGTTLLADRYAPQGIEKPPLILIRSCYGRSGFYGLIYGRIFSEHGFQVLIQSTRGTFGSGGTFRPQVDEHDDGLATVAWLKRQPWYPGAFITYGPSYLGLVQWAIASEAGPDLKAMAIQVSASEFRSRTYAGESFGLDNALTWVHLLAQQEHTNLLKSILSPASRKLKPLFAHLPLNDLDQLADGQHSAFYQELLEHDQPGDVYWQQRDFSGTLKDLSVPINLIGGWYDIFLPWELRDYRLLREAGQQPYLTIGPWAHASRDLMPYALRESLGWLKAVLRGEGERYRQAPVRVFVTGANEWRDLADWPPPGLLQQWMYLQPGFALAAELPPTSEPDQYRYDPADPTPALVGPLLLGLSLPTENRELEVRSDVLTYTSAPLEQDLEVIGPVLADLFVRSSLEHTDFFVRLCDVDQQGRSLNVCDALQRLKPGAFVADQDGIQRVSFELWPTAHRFRVGHRLRVQVSSGAHPRYARNPGSGEPLASATRLIAADQSIYHDPEHPSSIVLSLVGAQTAAP